MLGRWLGCSASRKAVEPARRGGLNLLEKLCDWSCRVSHAGELLGLAVRVVYRQR